MSRARQIRHRALVHDRKVATYRRRQYLPCRAHHWPTLYYGRVFDDYRRPFNQYVRVAWLSSGRCRQHRSVNLSVTMVVSRSEEFAASSPTMFYWLLSEKLNDAENSLWLNLTPWRVRRAQPFPPPTHHESRKAVIGLSGVRP